MSASSVDLAIVAEFLPRKTDTEDIIDAKRRKITVPWQECDSMDGWIVGWAWRVGSWGHQEAATFGQIGNGAREAAGHFYQKLKKYEENQKTLEIPKVSWFLPILAFLSDQLAKVLLQEGQWNTATAMWTWSTWYYNGLLKSWRPAPAASVASCQESPRIVSSRRSCPHLPTVISEILPRITDPLTLHLVKNNQVPDALEGRVGFMGSGSEMTKFQEARKRPGWWSHKLEDYIYAFWKRDLCHYILGKAEDFHFTIYVSLLEGMWVFTTLQ